MQYSAVQRCPDRVEEKMYDESDTARGAQI